MSNEDLFATPRVSANDVKALLNELNGLRVATLAQDADMLTLLLAFSDAKIDRVSR